MTSNGTRASERGADLPLKRSIALVIAEPDRASGEVAIGGTDTRWLLVLRPEEDELSAVWGLPAGSYRDGETDEDLIRRIGRDKLGVEVMPLRALNERVQDRAAYRISMRLHAARIVGGQPNVPQDHADVTQYAEWAWRPPRALTYGAEKGSLCCQLGLELMPEGHP